MKKLLSLSVCLLAFGTLVTLSGCGQSGGASSEAKTASADDHNHADGEGDHDGWWCAEHGVPEEECALCDSSLIAGFKEKGDWCEEHNRPESQCFLCSPKRAEKFIARYEVKYGKKPPKREE